MKRFSAAVLVTAVLALFAVVPLPNHNVARAASGCTAATLSGNYGFTENVGFIAPQPPSPPTLFVPAARLGLINFSPGSGRTGSFILSFTQSVAGQIITDSTSGPYTVNSNCTGSINLATGEAAGEAYAISIVNGGTQVLGMRSDAGFTIDATMIKQ